jgi:hypothetical protein
MITKQPTWLSIGSKAIKNTFRDKDKDGVVNLFDCQPGNPKKQGWEQNQWKEHEALKNIKPGQRRPDSARFKDEFARPFDEDEQPDFDFD